MWRPDDWDSERVAKENLPSFTWGTKEYGDVIRGVDLGADAMLESLESVPDCIRHDNSGKTTFHVMVKQVGSQKGKWVFIPDKGAKG